jgi:hypothetical protein
VWHATSPTARRSARDSQLSFTLSQHGNARFPQDKKPAGKGTVGGFEMMRARMSMIMTDGIRPRQVHFQSFLANSFLLVLSLLIPVRGVQSNMMAEPSRKQCSMNGKQCGRTITGFRMPIHSTPAVLGLCCRARLTVPSTARVSASRSFPHSPKVTVACRKMCKSLDYLLQCDGKCLLPTLLTEDMGGGLHPESPLVLAHTRFGF